MKITTTSAFDQHGISLVIFILLLTINWTVTTRTRSVIGQFERGPRIRRAGTTTRSGLGYLKN